MIELLIFHLHIAGALYAFTKNWQAKGVKDGLLAVALITLVFTIGWALTGTIAHAVYPQSLNTIYFNSDILGLLLLLIPESFFFYFYFVKDK
jgi:hypothetical protein